MVFNLAYNILISVNMRSRWSVLNFTRPRKSSIKVVSVPESVISVGSSFFLRFLCFEVWLKMASCPSKSVLRVKAFFFHSILELIFSFVGRLNDGKSWDAIKYTNYAKRIFNLILLFSQRHPTSLNVSHDINRNDHRTNRMDYYNLTHQIQTDHNNG